MSTDSPKPTDDSKAAAGCFIAIAIFAALAFYGWYSGGWERGYQRERAEQQRRARQTLETLERVYEMSPDEYQRALDDANRDAPIGQTRGGDTY